MKSKLKIIFGQIVFFIGLASSITGIITFLSEKKYQTPIILISSIIILIIVIYFSVRYILRRNKEMKHLKDRVTILEKTKNVPFFKKWHIIYSCSWKNDELNQKNQISLELSRLKVKVCNGKKFRDANLTQYFKGEYTKRTDYIIYTIAGVELVDFKNINFIAKDLRLNCTLHSKIIDNGRDVTIKDIIISLPKRREKGDFLELQFEWTWPKMLSKQSDFISLPNIFSIGTNKLELIFEKDDSMSLNNIEAYKYNFQGDKPIFLRSLYSEIDNSDQYMLSIHEPEEDTDYIIYYE